MSFHSITINGVEIIVFRDDLNHATVSGNKLHKLKPSFNAANTHSCTTILSFGGPFSNHLHALAWASKESGFNSIGVVRGELHAQLTPTLRDCAAWGMRLVASTRKDYRAYQNALALTPQPCLASELKLTIDIALDEPERTLVIPEGGSNEAAIESLNDAYSSVLRSQYCQGITHAVCATGTGATLAGLYKATKNSDITPLSIVGIQAVAEQDATLHRIHHWLKEQPTSVRIEAGHLGGFGKTPAELMTFIDAFETTFNVPLDPVYNGKAMLKISQMINAGAFKKSDKILFIHTGGLQGKRSLNA